ncbi:MAG: radical SAM protein [Myxococcota bacterium]
MSPPAVTYTLESASLQALLTRSPAPQLPEGWRLTSAMPHHEGGVLLVVTHPEHRTTLGLQVRPTDAEAPAWRRTPHLDLISHIPEDTAEAVGLRRLQPLADRLQALDAEDADWRTPEPAGDLAPPVRTLRLPEDWLPEAMSPFSFGRVYVLDLASDCGQRCTFCSTRAKFSPEANPTPEARERFVRGMRLGRRDGYDVLRLSGLDPLTHPQVFELLTEAVSLGFRHIHIYSPFTRLADPSARAALRDAAGSVPFTLHVPVYGPDALTHDAVTGVPGSFDAVSSALAGLIDEGLGNALNLLTVVTRGNLSRLEETARWLRQWQAPIQVFLPFPTTRAADDAFYQVAVPHRELVSTFAACAPPIGLAELLPCVRFRHEAETGQPTLTTGGFHPTTALLGTLFEHADYRRVGDVGGNTFTIPVRRCPHADSCALSVVCPRAVYEVYAERFGLGELVPVCDEELERLSPTLADFIRPA